MIVEKCKWETWDKVTFSSVCVNPSSNKFSMLKTGNCTSIHKGCKYWESYNPISAVVPEEELPFEKIMMFAKIF